MFWNNEVSSESSDIIGENLLNIFLNCKTEEEFQIANAVLTSVSRQFNFSIVQSEIITLMFRFVSSSLFACFFITKNEFLKASEDIINKILIN